MALDDENPYAPPKSDAIGIERHLDQPDLAWCDRNTLIVRKGAELPDRCIKCNAAADGYRFSRSLSWLKPTWIVVFLISPLLYVLVYLLVRWKGRVTVGLCELHRRRRTRAIALAWLSALAGIAAFLVAGAAAQQFQTIIILAGFALLIGGLIVAVFGSRVLMPTRIDKHFIWLSKVSPDYLAEFRDWNA